MWDERRGRLIWVDIRSSLVWEFDPASSKHKSHPAPFPVTAVVPRSGSGYAVATRRGFGFMSESLNSLEIVAEVEPDKPGNRMNDGKCDPAGRFLAGTMDDSAVPNAGGLYRLSPDLTVDHLLRDVSISNGLAWSHDGKLLYYIDTPTGGVDVLTYDVESGAIGPRRLFVSIAPDVGFPDGMTIDEEGCIWVAIAHGSAVHRYAPDGRLDCVVQVPASVVTSCTFGGPDLRDLYITTSADGVRKERVAHEPFAGSLFRLRTETRGMPTNAFGG